MFTCEKCKYSKSQDGERFCHVLPPAMVKDGCFPRVADDDFCGEGLRRVSVFDALLASFISPPDSKK